MHSMNTLICPLTINPSATDNSSRRHRRVVSKWYIYAYSTVRGLFSTHMYCSTYTNTERKYTRANCERTMTVLGINNRG